MQTRTLKIAMLSIHSSPIGRLGTRDTGGMSVYIRGFAKELGHMGHTVDIFTARPDGLGDRATASLGKNVRLVQLGRGRKRAKSATALYCQLPYLHRDLEAFRSARAVDYDLIHSHYWLSGCLGRIVQKQWDRPHVVTFHTLSAVKSSIGIGPAEPVLRLANEKKLARECQLIFSATEKEKEQLLRFYHTSPQKVVIVPCGVDLGLFRPAAKETARRKLGFNRAESLVLFVGRFEPLKGIDRLLGAAAILARQRELRVIIVGGDGPRTAEEIRLRRIVHDSGLDKCVVFAGRVDQGQLPLYYSAADVLALPSHYESFGLVALESLACGTPVVATPVGAMDSLLVEGRSGHVVHESGDGAFAEGIARFLRSTGTGYPNRDREEIRASIRHLGWPNVAASLAEEYQNACGDKGAK